MGAAGGLVDRGYAHKVDSGVKMRRFLVVRSKLVLVSVLGNGSCVYICRSLDNNNDSRSFLTKERPDDSKATPPKTTSLTSVGAVGSGPVERGLAIVCGAVTF